MGESEGSPAEAGPVARANAPGPFFSNLTLYFKVSPLWQTDYQKAVGMRVRRRFAWIPVQLYRSRAGNLKQGRRVWLRFVIEKTHANGWIAWELDNPTRSQTEDTPRGNEPQKEQE